MKFLVKCFFVVSLQTDEENGVYICDSRVCYCHPCHY
jgi:hypothetical protein